jgi:hypothetical protein
MSVCGATLHRCRRAPAAADPSEAGAPVVDAGRSGGEGRPRQREASFPRRRRPCEAQVVPVLRSGGGEVGGVVGRGSAAALGLGLRPCRSDASGLNET